MPLTKNVFNSILSASVLSVNYLGFFMKLFSILSGRSKTVFFLFSFLFLTVPYAAPLFQNSAPEVKTPVFWISRIVFSAAVSAAMLLISSWISKKAIRIPIVGICWAGLELLVLFEVFMYCFAGRTFDQSFLLHFNLEALNGEVMKVFWKPTAAVLLLYFAAVAGVSLLSGSISPKKLKLREIPVMLAAVGLLFLPHAPLAILLNVIANNIQISSVQNEAFPELDNITATPGKNLVFIVVESLEQNYLDEKHFPGLLPRISKWMKNPDALVFDKMISTPTNTFDFLYQSHMGDYMYSLNNSNNAGRRVSLSLILQKAGYKNSFLKACPLTFANTGEFVKKVRYEERQDCTAPGIKSQLTETGPWGFRDYELFRIAKNEFKRLAAEKKPFCFTLFTVDGHAPDGVLGQKSLSYTAPDGSKFSLLSSVHTTDAALGDFLEFIKNSPEGKNTVVVITGDHLVMKNLTSTTKSVQSMLEYKERKNLLTFILNGKNKGNVSQPCWPVDLAPIILDQMGVVHNAEFPRGVNILQKPDAPPRRKLSYSEYVENVRQRTASTGKKDFLSQDVFLLENNQNMILYANHNKIPVSKLYDHEGTFLGFHAVSGTPTAWRDYISQDTIKLFNYTNPDPHGFFFMWAERKSILHFLLGADNWNHKILATLWGGWYRFSSAANYSRLKLNGLNIPIPKAAEASININKNIVTLQKDGWSFPLFSKTNTYFPRGVIAAYKGPAGIEVLERMDFRHREKMSRLKSWLNSGRKMTAIIAPDSQFHRKFGVPEEKTDHILRVNIDGSKVKTETFSMRLPGEYYIRQAGAGEYYYQREGETEGIRLTGPAPESGFANGYCHIVSIDPETGKILSSKSFKEVKTAAELMLSKKKNLTLLFCGKDSEFLKTYYPNLAKSNVLFTINRAQIRQAVQYSNGNFRIPNATEPVDVLGGAGAVFANNILILHWGNASFAINKRNFDALMLTGKEWAMRIQHFNPAGIFTFSVDKPSGQKSIHESYCRGYLVFGFSNSIFPKRLNQSGKSKFFLAINRGLGWELYRSNTMNFSIAPEMLKFQ